MESQFWEKSEFTLNNLIIVGMNGKGIIMVCQWFGAQGKKKILNLDIMLKLDKEKAMAPSTLW